MTLLIRIDVDRPYGKRPLFRHILSRICSDFYFPRIEAFDYLNELKIILNILNNRKAKSYIFFRRCTLPSQSILELIHNGGHEIGFHLENSRSFDTFIAEKAYLERHIGRPVSCFSKHGSGGNKYGLHHFAPYEPEKYLEWGQKCGMKLFFGNLENPSMMPVFLEKGFTYFPSAFWLEPAWRDINTYDIDWIIDKARVSDIVLLLHPENILADPALLQDFKRLLLSHETRILE
jgi:hypothetical protein